MKDEAKSFIENEDNEKNMNNEEEPNKELKSEYKSPNLK